MLKGTITLNDQEREGTYDFTKAALYLTNTHGQARGVA